MNSKIHNGLDKVGQPISLKLVLENDINRLHSFSGENHLDTNISIHQMRKSLKSISAVLLLYKVQFDQSQYLSSSSFIKSLAKQFGILREPYVNLQTFNRIENKLKELNCIDLFELRYKLEKQYNLILDNLEGSSKETFLQGHESIIKLTEELNILQIDFNHKLLKRRLLISFKKSQRLFKKLNISSSSDKFHEFRKSCKIFYFQEAVLNRIGSERTSRRNKKLYKLTEYLGKEHDLQLFYQYLTTHFPELSRVSEALFRLKIKRLRKKALGLYPKIHP